MASNYSPSPAPGEVSRTREHNVFGGLTPRNQTFATTCETPGQSLRRSLMGGLPLIMTGSLATGVIATPLALDFAKDPENAVSNSEKAEQRPGLQARLDALLLPIAHTVLSATRPDLPTTYVVQAGDSVSAVADRFGIPTPAILTLNGLSWNAKLHEGQVLKLTAEPTKKRGLSPARLAPEGYIVQPGETATRIAERLGISTHALLAHNGLGPDDVIVAGAHLKVPGATKTTVNRVAPNRIPIVANAPQIVQASVASKENEEEEEHSEELPAPFDAADLALAEKPKIIPARVQEKPAAPPPAPKPPVVEEKKPAPVAQASAPATPTAQPTSSVGQPVSGTITPLNDERRTNARIIVSVGRELGVPDYGIVIALATAMQESSLRNINWGDRDSVGLFQQRPSTGWGTAEQILDPAYATRLFFGGPSNPNAGKTRGLLDISGWANMALTDAAQRVQISAFPQAYAKWEASAWAWLYELS
jgi:N-acetylmuramoyl-L-alanine amidase